jgi:hypothetical protein
MFSCQEESVDTALASAVGWVSMASRFASRLRVSVNPRSLSRGPASFRCKAELGVCGVREGPRRLVKLTSGVLFWGCMGYSPAPQGGFYAPSSPPPPLPNETEPLRYTPPHGHLDLPPLRQSAPPKHVGRPPTNDEGSSSRTRSTHQGGAGGPSRTDPSGVASTACCVAVRSPERVGAADESQSANVGARAAVVVAATRFRNVRDAHRGHRCDLGLDFTGAALRTALTGAVIP